MADLASEDLGGHFHASFVAIHDITIVTIEADTDLPCPWNFKASPNLNNNQTLFNPSSTAPDLLQPASTYV